MKKTVFLGDSLTAHFTELKNHENVSNRGVSGDRTIDVIERLNEIRLEEPEQVLLLIGINDIMTNNHIWFTDFPISIKTTYEFIVQYLVRQTNSKATYLLSILPVSSFVVIKRDIETAINQQIDEMNIFIKNLATQYQLTYVDLNQHFKEQNKLKKAFTTDGVHLTPAGYSLFYELIKKYLI